MSVLRSDYRRFSKWWCILALWLADTNSISDVFFRAKRTKIKVAQPSSKPGSRIFSLNTNDHPRVTSKSFFRVKWPKKVESKEFEGDLGRTEIVGEMRVKMAGRFFLVHILGDYTIGIWLAECLLYLNPTRSVNQNRTLTTSKVFNYSTFVHKEFLENPPVRYRYIQVWVIIYDVCIPGRIRTSAFLSDTISVYQCCIFQNRAAVKTEIKKK